MGYRYTGDVNELEGTPPVGTGQCVALIQVLADAPHTSHWRAGKRVVEAAAVAPGTAIATFANPTARFRSSHGNHAALFMSFGPTDPATRLPRYIVVMDQWIGRKVKSRRIDYYTAEAAKAKGILDSDNAAAFYVLR